MKSFVIEWHRWQWGREEDLFLHWYKRGFIWFGIPKHERPLSETFRNIGKNLNDYAID